MKKFLLESVSALTIFAMVFGANMAVAQEAEAPETIIEDKTVQDGVVEEKVLPEEAPVDNGEQNLLVEIDNPQEDDESEEPSCNEMILARVVLTDFSNEGSGDLDDVIFLGSTSNSVSAGTWFDTSNLDADDINNFADVPGIALRRETSGKIVLELHGSQGIDDGEHVEGYIEFWNGVPTLQTPAAGSNELEANDSLSIVGDKSNFELTVSTGDDRFATDFEFQLEEDCEEPEEAPSCDNETIWARVVITNFSNTGVGDVTDTIYLGSAGNPIPSGTWFDTSIVDVGSIEDYADVPGVAVKRRGDNKIVLELFGRHDNPEDGNETVEGYIEFWNGVPTAQIPSPHISQLEFMAGSVPADVISMLGDKSYFELHVNTGGDRFDTVYEFVEEDCTDPQDPPCEGDCPPVEPNCQEDQSCDDEDPPCIVDCGPVIPNEPNDDSEEESGGGSSGSFVGGGGGQVLGAKTGDVLGACDPFTEYHRRNKADVGGDIARIQEFLNDHMSAGLVITGVYDKATVKAVHAFQKKYFEQVISPWHPPLPLRTTGNWLQTTKMMANEIIGCPEEAVYLPEPNIMYKVKWTPAQ